MFVIDFSPHITRRDYYPARNVRIGPGSATLAVTFGVESASSQAVWWNLTEGRFVGAAFIFPDQIDCVAEPAFLPDLSRVYFHAHQGMAAVDYILAVAPGEPLEDADDFGISADPDMAGANLSAMAISPNGRWLVTGIEEFDAEEPGITVQELPTKSGKSRHKMRGIPMDLSDGEWPTAFAFSADGKRLACGQSTGTVRILDFKTGDEVSAFETDWAAKPGDEDARGLAFSPDGQQLAVRVSGKVLIFDLDEDDIAESSVQLKSSKFTGMAFTPDGRRLLTSGLDHLVRVWDAVTWQEVARFDWKIGEVHSVTVSPDGLTAAAGGEKSCVVVWDLDG